MEGLENKGIAACDLTETNLSEANLSGAKVINADLSLADLTGTDLSFADLAGVDFFYANLTDSDLADAVMWGVGSGYMTGTPSVLPARWSLINGSLIGPSANLWFAELVNQDLTGVDLTGADLTGADLTGADLTETDQLDHVPVHPAPCTAYRVHRPPPCFLHLCRLWPAPHPAPCTFAGYHVHRTLLPAP